MSKGYSYSTFGGEIGVSRQTLHLWEKDFPEWKEAKGIGYERGLKFFETLLITKAVGRKLKNSEYGIDLSAATFALRSRFHKEYGDKVQHDVEVNPNANKITVEFVKPKPDEAT